MTQKIKFATVAGCYSTVATYIIDKLAKDGTKIIGFGRAGSEDRAAALEAKYDGQVKIILGDMADEQDAQRMVAQAHTHLGQIDAHYHCAGIYSWQHWSDAAGEQIQALMRVNYQTAWMMAKLLTPIMKAQKQSAMVFASARDTSRFIPAGFGPYMASKMALNGLVESLASELIHDNITVNAVQPTIIDTEVNRKALPDIPADHFVDPSQMADIMIDISQPDRYQLSGALIPINSKLI